MGRALRREVPGSGLHQAGLFRRSRSGLTRWWRLLTAFMNALQTAVRPAVPSVKRVSPRVVSASQASFRNSGLPNSGFSSGKVSRSRLYSRVYLSTASLAASANP